MSVHFCHYLKYSHENRRKFFSKKIREGDAVVIERLKTGFVVETTDGNDYRISRKGRVIKCITQDNN